MCWWLMKKKKKNWLWAAWVASYLQRSLSAQVNGGSKSDCNFHCVFCISLVITSEIIVQIILIAVKFQTTAIRCMFNQLELNSEQLQQMSFYLSSSSIHLQDKCSFIYRQATSNGRRHFSSQLVYIVLESWLTWPLHQVKSRNGRTRRKTRKMELPIKFLRRHTMGLRISIFVWILPIPNRKQGAGAA